MDDISSKLLYGCLETLILAILAKEPLHGYRLKWTLAEKSKYRHGSKQGDSLVGALLANARPGLRAQQAEPLQSEPEFI